MYHTVKQQKALKEMIEFSVSANTTMFLAIINDIGRKKSTGFIKL